MRSAWERVSVSGPARVVTSLQRSPLSPPRRTVLLVLLRAKSLLRDGVAPILQDE